MPAIGKEIERRPNIDDLAIREVESYVEKIEKQSESQAQTQQTNTGVVSTAQSQSQQNTNNSVFASTAVSKQKIVLPLSQSQIEEGLHHKIVDGIKWLSEWCVMMIKKYPGRVFYLPADQQV